jgi:hypothetical protein
VYNSGTPQLEISSVPISPPITEDGMDVDSIPESPEKKCEVIEVDRSGMSNTQDTF